MATPKPNLATLGSKLSATTGSPRSAPTTAMAAPATVPESAPARPKDRGVPITFHMPDEVRDQLKMLAVRRKTTMHDLGAEAFNDLFAKHGLPEIAPATKRP